MKKTTKEGNPNFADHAKNEPLKAEAGLEKGSKFPAKKKGKKAKKR